MIDVATLRGMSEDDLREWLLARMRGEKEDPPLSTMHLETPFDFVCVACGEPGGDELRTRLGTAAVRALVEAAKGDLRGGPDARAVRALAFLVDRLELADAAALLRAIAMRGAAGERRDALADDVEDAVLVALAGLQKPRDLWNDWEHLWSHGPARLWPIAALGMRRSIPERALRVLPEAVLRAREDKSFGLGQVLWSFATDPRLETGDLPTALAKIPASDKERCRAELRKVGATEDEIGRWLPNSADSSPEWKGQLYSCRRESLKKPPFPAADERTAA